MEGARNDSDVLCLQVFRDPNVENALKQVEGASLMLCSVSPSDWSSALKGSDVERLMRVSVNPKSKVENSHGLVQFSAYVSNFIRAVPLGSMLQASDVIGNISFSRPVLYIFPGHQGDAALFGMKGFNMLVNGGYSRRSCFWDFVRHLDGIDALLLTHLGPDNLFGIKAVLERKSADTIHPDIDYMYMNTGKATNGIKAVANGDASSTDGDLVINLAAEGGRLLELSRKLGHTPHPLTRPLSGNLEPINLFHKVGKGSLDMYVLNPVGDAKEMKDFLTQWGKRAPSFSQANGVPIPNCTSICVLLVVRPASPTEKVTRILFPGNAPQHKLLEGLERVKHLEFLKHPTFCTQDMHKPKKAAAGNGRAGSATRRPPSAVTSRTTSVKPEPPKRLETKASAPRVAAALPASAKAAKLQKDSNNKRASSAKDKEKVKLDEKEKEDKSKSSASSSPSKASVKTASPVKSPCSPTKTPDDILEIAASPAALSQTLISEAAVNEPLHPDSLQDNHLSQSLSSPGSADLMKQVPVNPEPIPADDNRMAESPEALPEPEHYGSDVDFGLQQGANTAMTEREKLQELGIYDDDDEGVDNGFDDKENGSMFGASGSPEVDDEDVQPQPLPEPVAAVETPTCAEPDLIHDSFTKPSAMEQSQIFEDGIEPDYGADAKDSSLATDSQVQEMQEMEPADLPQANSLKQEEMEEAAPPAESRGLTEDAPSSPEPEQEDPKGFPDTDHLKETIPAAEEPSFSDKEPSPDPEEPGCVDDLKEAGPALEEPSFNEENEAAENSNAIEQSIQYGVTNDNSFQMGGIREEEEEEEEMAAEKEEVKRLDEVPVELREEKQHLGVCDDQGQDEEEAGDAATSEKDAYVYEKDVNLEDEEVCMAGVTHDASEDLAMDRGKLAVDREELAVDREDLAMDRGKLAVDREELAVDREDLAMDRGELAVDREELAVDREDLAMDRGELAVDREELAVDRGELSVDREELAVDRGELAVDRGELAMDRGELAVDREELAMDRGELAMDRGELAVDREELAMERGDLAVDREELAMDRGELAVDREEEQELQREGLAQDSEAEQDQQSSNIPEAFEKDESPTPVEKPVAAEIEGGDDAAAGQEDSGREDTDSIDGGTPDDDKDIDEILAMQQQGQIVAEKENEEVDKPRPGQEEGHNFNPFIGLGTPNPPVDPADAQFDPLAQWGPPTGLPAPTPLHKVGEGDMEEAQEVTVLGVQEYLGQEAVSGQEVAGGLEEGTCTEGVGEHSPAVHGLATPPLDDQIGTADDGEGKDAAGTEKLSEADPTEFDPLAEWGQPMGLPSPPPPEVDSKSSAARSGGGDAKKADPKKATGAPARGKTGLEKRPTSGTKSPAKPANGTTEAPKTARSKADPKKASLDTSRSARPASGRSLDTSKIESKTRPTTTSTTRRVASATTKARASPDVVKMPPLPPFTPFYMDLTYIPNHGELAYVDSEFFKRVRARYYVLSARNPNPKILELLMDAKATWDKAGEQEVTVIPTYETPILQHWMAVHKERLAENKIDIAPAASRCTVRLQDHEDSCYTYRLEF